MTIHESDTEEFGDQIDDRILPLVRALNEMPGITTIGSCGGHKEPMSGGSWPHRSWYVTMGVTHSDVGWRSLEFLGWVINNDAKKGKTPTNVEFYPQAAPPYINEPGKMLNFAMECYDDSEDDPADWARRLSEFVAEFYVPARRWFSPIRWLEWVLIRIPVSG